VTSSRCFVIFSGIACLAMLTAFGPKEGSSDRSTSAAASGAPAATSSPASKANSRYDSRFLLKEFQESQQAELKAHLAREYNEMKTLKKEQTARQKEFDQREKEARRKFFAEIHPGEEKRAYMKALLARRDAFRQELGKERAQAKETSDNRIRSLKDQQLQNLKKFEEALDRGERPSDSLWPQPGL
jgi:hypothetical protein